MSERGGYSGLLSTADGAAGISPSWLTDLESCHERLRRIHRLLESFSPPPIDLGLAAKYLEHSFVFLFDAMDERADRVLSVRGVMAELVRLDGELRPAFQMDPTIAVLLTEIHEAHAEFGRVEAKLVSMPPNTPTTAPDLSASRETFKLHSLNRPSIPPQIRVQAMEPQEVTARPPEPLPQPKTFEELDKAVAELKKQAAESKKEIEARVAEALPPPPKVLPKAPSPPGFTKDIPEVVSEVDFVRSKARECFEEITMIGTQRAPLLGDPWRTALTLERRMLASMDVLASLGPAALAYLEPLVLDSPVKDPTRAFGMGAALGCFSGRDALASAERAAWALRQNDAESLSQFADALKIVPHGSIQLAMRGLLSDRDPAMRAMALDVLAYRGLATPEDITKAAMDVASVAAKALPYAAILRLPIVNDAIFQALGSGDPAATRSAWLAMAYVCHPQMSSLLSASLGSEDGEFAALLLALGGDAADSETLLRAAVEKPERPLITAVGWAGASDSVATLIGFLEHPDAPVKLSAAYALDRITGAGMYEENEVPAEEIDVPEPPDPDIGEPKPLKLAKMVSDPRDLPSEPAPDIVTQPTTNVERWRAYWMEKGNLFKSGLRYRRGYPYTPLVSLQELDSGPCTPGERRSLQRELVMRTGHHVRFDPMEMVLVQQEALAEWLPIAQRLSTKPGQWSRPYR